MLRTAHRVLDSADAEDYLVIIMAFMSACSCARELVDVNIAAGVAEEELIEFRDRLLFPSASPPLRRVS